MGEPQETRLGGPGWEDGAAVRSHVSGEGA